MNKCQVWFCFLKFLNIFKEPSFLQNLVFMLVEVNVVGARNSDANSKKERQGFAFLIIISFSFNCYLT